GTLAAALDDWAAAARRPSGPLRVCFRLVEPPEDDPGGPWSVQFALQGTDDPSLYVPAAAIWTGEVTSVADAEETLLAGLGRALRLYPQIAEALRVATPTSVTTDAAGAFAFLREAAPLLSAAGFGVQLPQWAGRARLGMKLTTRTTTTESGATVSSGFGLGDLVAFRWDLAIEGEDLTEEELTELARLKAPLVRLRGKWVELDDAQLKAALEFLSRGRSGEMSASQAVRAAIHAGDDTLPLLGVDADGALGDLLSGEADRRLEPIATPESFEGTLRPYQERGLAWLSFLDDLGLGAVLADDMGLGKCLCRKTPVLVNGALIAAADIWARFAGPVEFDGEGEWAKPTETLTTSSLDRAGHVIQAEISRLYRQHVREPLREITLSDGATITVTRRHRLLRDDGWTNRIRPGDRVRVPGRLAHDPDRAAPLGGGQVLYATVVSVEDVDYEGWVHDFEVPEHHNYVAAGLFCHNTAQTLALLASRLPVRRERGATLLIGPMSLVGNWQREAARFTPKLRVYVHHGGGRHRGEELEQAVRGADLVLTTYGTAARDREALAAIEWDRVVCDEAQALKNSGTRQAQAVRSIPARGRIALTGTPVENHLTELWSIMEFA
ncbi:MAG: SNF2 helicase-associated domain-containing protein, partial [Actinoallomurus sp.]